MASSDNPDRYRVAWKDGGKPKAMDLWSKTVMADQSLSRSAIRIAWALSYSFSSEDGRSWEKKASIARRVSLSASTVKGALNELDKRGHIERPYEVVAHHGKLRVIRPCHTRLLAGQLPRQRKGGVAKGVNPREIAATRGTEDQSCTGTDGQFDVGTDVETPCIQESSKTNPRNPQDVTPGAGNRLAEQDRFRRQETEKRRLYQPFVPLLDDDDMV